MSDAAGTLAVEMLPARHGDCILLTWAGVSHSHRMLIDAGPASAYGEIAARLRSLPDRSLDLLVLTHIDADHVEGTILLANDRELGLKIGEVWFNGAPQLSDEYLAPVHGEILGMIVSARNLPWNASFRRAPLLAPDDGELLSKRLCCGLRLTVIAPDRPTLRTLRDAWRQSLKEAHLDFGSEADALKALYERRKLLPADSFLGKPALPKVEDLARRRSGTDTSVPNASSIVLLAEFGDRRLLLAGDATPGSLVPGVRRLLKERPDLPLPINAFKLAHHGSANNISEEIVRLIPSERYLFSSNGSYFNHPDDTAVATVIKHAPAGSELVFNYRSPRTLQWDDRRLIEDFGYRVRYPERGEASVRLSWTGVA